MGAPTKTHLELRDIIVEEFLGQLKDGQKALGLSGKINTAFIERLNLTLRQGVSFMARRTWGMAQSTSELEVYLEWWRGYYH